MWVQFVIPAQSDADGVVVPFKRAILTRVQSVTRWGPIVEGGQTFGPETTISLDRFFPPVLDESEFVDAYLCSGGTSTTLLLTCGSVPDKTCYNLNVRSVLFFETLSSERFAELLQ